MMGIILSPAKTMRQEDILEAQTRPIYGERAGRIARDMLALGYGECKRIWKCNEHLAGRAYGYLEAFAPEKGQIPAIFAYEGLQYQHLAPRALEAGDLAYLQEHLRIVSGMYGLLRPFDGVMPYRLEMQARLYPDGDMGQVWQEAIGRAMGEFDMVLDLASKEYSEPLYRYRRSSAWGADIVRCVFGEEAGGKIRTKATLAKMARGQMARYLAVERIVDVEGVKGFSSGGWAYAPEYSLDNQFVFLQRRKYGDFG